MRSLCIRSSLGHLSFGVEKFGVHWKITERSLGDRWDRWALLGHSLSVHWAFIEYSLSIHSAFIEHLLSIHWAFIERSLGDLWEIVFELSQTLRRPWWPWRSRDDQWQIIERSWWLISDHYVLYERLLRDLAIFLYHSMISQWSPPLCNGGFNRLEEEPVS